MSSKMNTLLLILIFFIGLCLLLYPAVSDYWNSLHQSRAIANYAEQVALLTEAEYDRILQAAREYNTTIAAKENQFIMNKSDLEKYDKLLNLAGNGVIGYIEIQSIGCSLPVYHGTSEPVLQVAIGHLNWTSLPIGGVNTHSVVSGHRGLPSAKLFTDIDKLVPGDTFVIRVLDETFTYEVDKVSIVDPDDVDGLTIQQGEDYCTLVTCTPYGINTHRLLVRGHRVENAEEAKTIRVTADCIQIEPIIVAPAVAMPMLLVLLVILMLPKRKS